MNHEIANWNDEMFSKHPTPYSGLAGLVERRRVKTVCRFAKITPDDRVLEIGCEAGNLLSRLPECKRLVGLDISKKALTAAQQRFEHSDRLIDLIQADAMEPMPFAKHEFSVIVCSEMLEHVPKPERVLYNIARIASPTTRIILTVPNEKPKLMLKKLLFRVGLLKTIMPGIEPEQSEWHLQYFSKHAIEQLVCKQFRIVRSKFVLGIHYVLQVQLNETPNQAQTN